MKKSTDHGHFKAISGISLYKKGQRQTQAKFLPTHDAWDEPYIHYCILTGTSVFAFPLDSKISAFFE
ncbi:MAG TPA: hypothetical protein VL053_12380 [Arachidicoccus sp.]|nr:hypothetical protein [Arachidicoccus sp.]